MLCAHAKRNQAAITRPAALQVWEVFQVLRRTEHRAFPVVEPPNSGLFVPPSEDGSSDDGESGSVVSVCGSSVSGADDSSFGSVDGDSTAAPLIGAGMGKVLGLIDRYTAGVIMLHIAHNFREELLPAARPPPGGKLSTVPEAAADADADAGADEDDEYAYQLPLVLDIAYEQLVYHVVARSASSGTRAQELAQVRRRSHAACLLPSARHRLTLTGVRYRDAGPGDPHQCRHGRHGWLR